MDRLRKRFVMLVVVRIVPCGAGAARMCECVLAEVYERCEGLSQRSDVPSQSTCRRSGLRPGLRPAATVICPVWPMHLRHLSSA